MFKNVWVQLQKKQTLNLEIKYLFIIYCTLKQLTTRWIQSKY